MTKRVLSLLLALTTLLSLGVPALAAGSGEAETGAVEKSAPAPAQAAGVTASGNCGAQGSNVTWKLTSDGVLTISGTGAMADGGSTKQPWYDYLNTITSVKILSGVTSIGDRAFQGCYSLTGVTIPGSVTSIGDYAFGWCNLTSVTIPAGVTSIGDSAFYECHSLPAINVAGGNKNYCSVGGVLFNKAKTELIQYPIKKSGASYSIPSSVTSIGDGAFSDCTSLTSVTIPAGVTSIGDGAFAECYSLSSVTVPAGVTTIGANVFWGCSSLPAINVASGNKNYCSVDGVLFNKAKTELIQYPGGKTGAYSIPSGVTSIGDNAFVWCYDLTSVTIPGSVTSIGNQAFFDCTRLTSVTIPGSVTSIGDSAFLFCDSLTSVTISNGVTYIGRGMFSGCTSLTSVTIPSSVTSIGDAAFESCESLTSVKIPSSVTSIGDYAFAWCYDLTSVTIPSSVTSIGDHAFAWCYDLTSVTIPSSVTSIGDYAFYGCSADLVISGYSGSYAEKYAKKEGIKFSEIKLSAPKLSKMENVNGGVKVTWGKVTGAEKYRVFYKPSGGSWAKAGDTTSTSYTWKGAKSGTSYQFRVWCVSADGKTQTSAYDAIKSITYVAAPNYTLSTPATGGIKLSWSKVAGASKYTVFYKTTGDWKTLTTTTATSYTVKSPKAGTKYTFRVRCVNSAGAVISGYITDKTLTYQAPAKPSQLPAPKLSKVENVNGGVKVTWGKVTGAEKYRVFYKPSGGSWAKAGDTTSTSYTWKGAKSGTTYQFRVWCISADGKKATSTYDTIKTITYVAAPNYTLSTPTTGGIKLSWSKVAGASKYTVFYKTTGDWKTLTTTADTSYTFNSPKAGTKYTFRVRCVNSAGAVISGYITDKTITYQTPAKPAQLPAPKLSKVENVNGGIKVTWGKVTGAEKYRVFYKPSGGSWAKAGDTTATSYTWKGAKSGTSYQFRVWCISADGKTQTSTYDTIKSITYVAAPSYTLSTPSTGGIKLSWSKVAGASKYTVFYKTTGDWKTLTTTTATSCTIKSPKAGTKYTFRVRCVNSAGAVISGYITDKTLTYMK